MVEQIIYTINKYSEIDLAELAKFSVEIWNAKGNQLSIDRFTNWLNNLRFSHEPYIIQAHKNSSLLGWLMLFAHSKTELELNPFALGGHPLIIQNADMKLVATGLLRKAVEFFSDNDYTRLELSFNKENSPEELFFRGLYASHNFDLIEEICHMRLNLQNYTSPQEVKLDKFNLLPINDVKNDSFFNCLSKTFKDTEDSWMLSLSDEEINNYFDNKVLDMSFPLIEGCSYGVFNESELIAYSVVKESHGANNGHLWIMGVLPRFRKQGIGAFLINAMLDYLSKNNYQSASLNVDLSNKTAYRLYKRKGFLVDWIRLAYVLKKITRKP